jgi:hypothetical protein
MSVLALLLILLPSGITEKEAVAEESVPSMDLLEYIGGMEQTSEGELLDPMDIPATPPVPASDKPQPYADQAFPES